MYYYYFFPLAIRKSNSNLGIALIPKPAETIDKMVDRNFSGTKDF